MHLLLNFQRSNFIAKFHYHPHPKDGEGTVFTGIFLSTSQCQVLSQASGPRSFPGGIPVLTPPPSGATPCQDSTGEASPAGTGLGYPLTRTGLGYPPDRTAEWVSTCYTAGGMPLAFTQEDFLVLKVISSSCRKVWENSESLGKKTDSCSRKHRKQFICRIFSWRTEYKILNLLSSMALTTCILLQLFQNHHLKVWSESARTIWTIDDKILSDPVTNDGH